jgi:polysaccharide deacetylase family protein (PEP-CTERM system associated)
MTLAARRFAELSIFPLATRACKLFSVDVEEWFHSNFESAKPVDTRRLPRRAAEGVERVLEALSESGSRATFFVLGELAEEQPDVVRRIAAAGQEVACHSFTHTLLSEQTPASALRDLTRARAVLEDLSGTKVRGFRAPSWSVSEKNLWALDVIAEAGFSYDSSIFPGRTYLYGIQGAPRAPYRLRTPSGNELVEVPPSTLGIGKTRLGVGGGFYLRVLPLWVHQSVCDRELSRGRPFMAYVHPRELDPESWSLKLDLSLKERLIHTGAMARGSARARALLRRGPWQSVGSLVPVE